MCKPLLDKIRQGQDLQAQRWARSRLISTEMRQDHDIQVQRWDKTKTYKHKDDTRPKHILVETLHDINCFLMMCVDRCQAFGNLCWLKPCIRWFCWLISCVWWCCVLCRFRNLLLSIIQSYSTYRKGIFTGEYPGPVLILLSSLLHVSFNKIEKKWFRLN